MAKLLFRWRLQFELLVLPNYNFRLYLYCPKLDIFYWSHFELLQRVQALRVRQHLSLRQFNFKASVAAPVLISLNSYILKS